MGAIVGTDDSVSVFGVKRDRTIEVSRMVLVNDNTTDVVKAVGSRNLGGNSVGGVFPVLDNEGLVHVFYRGPTRGLFHKSQSSITGQYKDAWENLGGVLASSPKISVSL